MKPNAPVAIFAYRRPDHLRNTLASLMKCDGFGESPVIVYGDGPRNHQEVASVLSTREVARTMLGKRAEYHFSETNRGLSQSVIAGVTETVQRFGRVIVLEDDLQVSPAFLTYMNTALDRYADNEKVFQVSGYIFDVPKFRHRTVALFLPFTVSWGWATWKRAWDQFDPMATGWETVRTDKLLRRRFNIDGAYDYATMLERQMAGLRDSWAIRWYWTVFKTNRLVLFPSISLVRNTGFDGDGTHGRGLLRRFAKGDACLPSPNIEWPETVGVEPELYTYVRKALFVQNGGWIAAVTDRLRRLLNR